MSQSTYVTSCSARLMAEPTFAIDLVEHESIIITVIPIA
jgi:hypothetical protein